MPYLQGALGSDFGGAIDMREVMTHATHGCMVLEGLLSAFVPNSLLDSVSMVVGKTFAELLDRWHHFLQRFCVCRFVTFWVF